MIVRMLGGLWLGTGVAWVAFCEYDLRRHRRRQRQAARDVVAEAEAILTNPRPEDR